MDSAITVLNSKVRPSFWDNAIYAYSETYHNINLHLANFTWLKVEAKPLKIFAVTVQNSVIASVSHLIPKKRTGLKQLSRQTRQQDSCTYLGGKLYISKKFGRKKNLTYFKCQKKKWPILWFVNAFLSKNLTSRLSKYCSYFKTWEIRNNKNKNSDESGPFLCDWTFKKCYKQNRSYH